MKFESDLTFVTGYIRHGKLVGQMSEQEYADWLALEPKEREEMLWEYGTVEVEDYAIEDVGTCTDVVWSGDE